MEYKLICFDGFGNRHELPVESHSDEEARERYNQIRLNNREYHDWRLWKPNLPWLPKLIAANEG